MVEILQHYTKEFMSVRTYSYTEWKYVKECLEKKGFKLVSEEHLTNYSNVVTMDFERALRIEQKEVE